MQDGCAGVDRSLLVGEVEARAHAQAADQGLGVFLTDLHTVGGGEVVAQHDAVGQFRLRFDEGKFGKGNMPTGFNACGESVVLRFAVHRTQFKVARKAAVFADQVDERTVVGEPGAVRRNAVGLVVGTAVVILGRSVGVGEGAAHLPAADDVVVEPNCTEVLLLVMF